jgi:hypothetical protein
MTFGRYTLAPGKEWTDVAATWPVRVVSRETEAGHHLVDLGHMERAGAPLTQIHLICLYLDCGQSVCCLAPDADQPGYRLDVATLTAGVLSHIRVCHEQAVTV